MQIFFKPVILNLFESAYTIINYGVARTVMILITVFFMGGNAAYAEGKTTSLNECITIAVMNNSDLKIQKSKVEESRFKYFQQIGFFLPQVDAAVGYTRYDKINLSQRELAGVQPITTRPELNDYTAGVVFNQVAFSGVKYYQLKSAKAAYDAETVKLEDSKRKTVLAVKTAYYEQLRSNYMVAAQKEMVNGLSEQKNMTALLYNSGKLTYLDVLKIQAQLSSYEDFLKNLENLSYTKALMLGQTMGSTEPIHAEMKLPQSTGQAVISDRCMENNFTDNPENAAARDMERKAEYDKKSSLSNALPTVSLRGNYYFEDTKLLPGNPNWYAGVAVTMPLFHGGTIYTETKQADARYEQSVENRKKTILSVGVRFQSAKALLFDKQNRIVSTQKTLDLSREVFTATKLKYGTGKVTTIELIDAQNTWNNAYLGFINNMLDYANAQAELESLCPDALHFEKETLK
ncbi:MAG: TolC family protein [Spirochaetota bacterium]